MNDPDHVHRDLKNVLSGFIIQRDTMAREYRAQSLDRIAQLSKNSVSHSHALDMMRANAVNLSRVLPTMNLAEWEALAELTGVYLSVLRDRVSNG